MHSPTPSTSSSLATPNMSHPKRAASYFDDDDESETESDFGTPPPKRGKGTKRSPGDKVAKKAARMQRNRIAAQASRDRKKHHVEILEARVAELESLLATASTSSSPPAAQLTRTSSSSFATLPSTASTPLSASISLAPSSPATLEEENAALRTQLEVELLQSASLKARLGSLEDKFVRLESLLRAPSPSSSFPTTSIATTSTVSTTLPSPLPTATTNDHPLMMTDSSCLVARKASSLQRKQSSPSSSPVNRLQRLRLRSAAVSQQRPTLHQILSSISVPTPSSTTNNPPPTQATPTLTSSRSIKLGANGRIMSSYPTCPPPTRSASPAFTRRTGLDRRTRTSTATRRRELMRLSTCSRTSAKTRLHLFVRR